MSQEPGVVQSLISRMALVLYLVSAGGDQNDLERILITEISMVWCTMLKITVGIFL